MKRSAGGKPKDQGSRVAMKYVGCRVAAREGGPTDLCWNGKEMGHAFILSERSKVMSRIKATGNRRTELAFVAFLRESGITGWRRHYAILGRPDFVFPKLRLAIFLDGCFWHCCPVHGNMPSANSAYWSKKLASNVARDRRVRAQLRRSGWRVLRVWEHDLRDFVQSRREIPEQGLPRSLRAVKNAVKKP